jgi:hypothetical protein
MRVQPALGFGAVGGRGRERGASRTVERGAALLEDAFERSKPRTIAQRLKADSRWFIQAAISTALAWTLAQALFDHQRPIFAAMGALIGVSAIPEQRRRAAIETILGVALGIGIADALVVLIGDGTLQLAAIVAGAMAAAVALGGGHVLVSEAAAAALLVVTVQPPGSGLSGERFLDSLLGGVVALTVTSLLPANPAVAARRAAAPLLAELAAILEDVARALERSDRDLAERVLSRARATEPDSLDQAVAAGRETLRLAPFAGATRARFAGYERAASQIDAAITSVEALTRGVLRALELRDNVPPPVPDAVRDLAEAVRHLDDSLDDPHGEASVREPARRAAARATLVLEQTANLSVSVIVVQVRSAAVDLLRGSGLTREEAERLVRESTRSLA